MLNDDHRGRVSAFDEFDEKSSALKSFDRLNMLKSGTITDGLSLHFRACCLFLLWPLTASLAI